VNLIHLSAAKKKVLETFYSSADVFIFLGEKILLLVDGETRHGK
jgi:hypothetical protein